jgi:hypothetical protein
MGKLERSDAVALAVTNGEQDVRLFPKFWNEVGRHGPERMSFVVRSDSLKKFRIESFEDL